MLREIDATYRHAQRRLRLDASHLIGPGHHLLRTTHGDLDCLRTIDNDRTYEDLIGSTTTVELADGLSIQVLELRVLIEMKRHAGRPKVLAVIPVLEATLDERDRRQ